MTVFLAIVLLAEQQAKSYTVASTASTDALVRECGSADADLTVNFCTGYVLATFDALSRHRLICPSDGVTSQQTMAVARRYLTTHPEVWDRSPSFVLERAFKAAYPCR